MLKSVKTSKQISKILYNMKKFIFLVALAGIAVVMFLSGCTQTTEKPDVVEKNYKETAKIDVENKYNWNITRIIYGEKGSISYIGKSFAEVSGKGSVKIDSPGGNILIIKGNPEINTYGTGICNKTKTHTLCRDIKTLNVKGENIILAVKGNGTLSAEGGKGIIIGKQDFREGNASLTFSKRAFAKIYGKGKFHISSGGKNLLIIKGFFDVDNHWKGKCMRIWIYTVCRGIEEADFSGDNLSLTFKGEGTLNAAGTGKITVGC